MMKKQLLGEKNKTKQNAVHITRNFFSFAQLDSHCGLYHDSPSPVKSLQAVTKLFVMTLECAFGFIDLIINIHFDNTSTVSTCFIGLDLLRLFICLPPPGRVWSDDFTKFDVYYRDLRA